MLDLHMADEHRNQASSPAYGSAPETDRIQPFFRRPFFLSLTIGIPFCIFKLLMGTVAIRSGAVPSTLLVVFGWTIILWAGLDLIMNLGRASLDLLQRSGPFEYCTLAQIGHFFQMPLAFLAIDTLITFLIICAMLWSGWITRLTTPESYLWYTATTLNLISLSAVSLYNEIRRESGRGKIIPAV
jgi:hypothetical protein